MHPDGAFTNELPEDAEASIAVSEGLSDPDRDPPGISIVISYISLT